MAQTHAKSAPAGLQVCHKTTNWPLSTGGTKYGSNRLIKESQRVLRGHNPIFTPTGDRIIYEANNELLAIKTDGTDRVKIAAPVGNKYWGKSAGGDSLVFRLVDLGHSPGSIWLLNVGSWTFQKVDAMK